MRPVLSIAVCARDDRHRLTLCLEGIARQVGPNMEVVVVNDGGPPIADVLEPFANRIVFRLANLDPPSAAYRLAAARNLALRLARAERVLFLDQDCVVSPSVLSAHAGYGAEAVAVVGLRHRLPEPEVAALGPADIPGLPNRDLRRDERLEFEHFRAASGRRLPMSAPWVTGCHVSVPTQLLRAIGGYWVEFVGWGYEDVEMALRLGRAGCSLEVRTDLAVVHLDHTSRINRLAVRKNRILLAHTKGSPEVVSRGPPLELIE